MVVGQSDIQMIQIFLKIHSGGSALQERIQHHGNRFAKPIATSLNPNEYQRCLGTIDELPCEGLRKTALGQPRSWFRHVSISRKYVFRFLQVSGTWIFALTMDLVRGKFLCRHLATQDYGLQTFLKSNQVREIPVWDWALEEQEPCVALGLQVSVGFLGDPLHHLPLPGLPTPFCSLSLAMCCRHIKRWLFMA